MKRALFLFALIGILVSSVSAQDRLREKDLEDTSWKLVIDLDSKKGDNVFERMALAAAGSFMDEIDIQFDFFEDGDLRVSVVAFGNVDDEDEWTNWEINDDGNLLIGDGDHFDIDDDTVFRLVDGDLIAYEKEKGRLVQKEEVYLARVER